MKSMRVLCSGATRSLGIGRRYGHPTDPGRNSRSARLCSHQQPEARNWGHLLSHLRELAIGPMLIGTWAAAVWAIHFYERHGFQMSVPRRKTGSQTVLDHSERQIDTSVVLADRSGGNSALKSDASLTRSNAQDF